MTDKDFMKKFAARLWTETNDLKRTPKALAQDLGEKVNFVEKVLSGESTKEEALSLVYKMGATYPIDYLQLIPLEDDTENGLKCMSAEESKASSRIFSRLDREGNSTPYYEYRDTAMSSMALFKPEWIAQLREVQDSDPNNPDVVFNHGHFQHQYGIFVNDVNFYWEVNGEKFGLEMNTGDSNYITPYWPHSFTSRNKDSNPYIIAVTNAADISRALRELHVLGENGINNYALNYRKINQAQSELIKKIMKDEGITEERLSDRLEGIDLDMVLDGTISLTFYEIEQIALALNVEPYDLMLPDYKPEEEVAVRKIKEHEPYPFPRSDLRMYDVHELVRTSKMPNLKGNIIDVKAKEPVLSNLTMENLGSGRLHRYMINFGDEPVDIKWKFKDEEYQNRIYPLDSIYMLPGIDYAFGAPEGGGNARLLIVGISGNIHIGVQREISAITNPSRIIKEDKPWFPSK